MRDLIMKCRRGEVSFAAFAEATEKYWRTAAADLLRRWDYPPAIEADDLVQEMLLSAWKHIETVDPTAGDPRKWVVFGAVKAARRWFHIQRGANGFARTSGRNRSPEGRYPRAVDWIEDAADRSSETSRQEEAIAILDSMKIARTEEERKILSAFWKGPSVEEIAVRISRPADGRRPGRKAIKAAKARTRKTIAELTERAENLAMAANL